MRNRRLQPLRTALLAVACSAMFVSPAWAQSPNRCNCYCQGVDKLGCLSNIGGESSTLCCVINTKCCTFTATCRCNIRNVCRKTQCYKNVCFWQDPCYCCQTSVYSCDPCGSCRYTASGCYQPSAA
jgi:hypothetical protein